MDAGPSSSAHSNHVYTTSPQDSGYDDYSDAGSGFQEDDSEVEGQEKSASDYSDRYEDEVHHQKGKGKGAANGGHRPAGVGKRPATKVEKQESKSWSDLDLSMVVALISPIGNWLTGSDHVKNLFLLLLLIFYLHQLIEVPWQLYRNSRARGISPSVAQKLRNSAKAVDEAAEVALTELRALELCYLCLTVVGPFLGAMLIRYVFAAMEGVDSLSWFSTTLFVLATGIRPWSHLITRLQERTSELHETVDLPSSEQRERETDKKLQVVMKRLDALEDAVIQLRAKAANIAPLQEACDELNDALGDVERSLLRQERKVETTRISQGSRLAVMESNVYRLEDLQRKDLLARRSSSRATATLEIPVYPRIHYALARLFELPTKLHTTVLTYLAANSAQKTLENASSSPPHSPLHNNSDQVHYFNE
ncbi:hypothetical protein EW026_g6941 [Hermanssonia centrifuga]|uniref:Uncharacterized protein n=1 Tax=Hermanssonia centrifuga TaxID=98765 RepID=A0A4S4KB56_9APHY|nr:hypothetical protein EW026_g6941 [Hermanssonia centrifuga]